jgi:RNA polymerase sigma-70 factor (ECF subfamily)
MAGFSDIHLSTEVSQRLLRGDRIAAGEAYREMAGAVMGLAVRILQDRGLAEEVVQDTFVELMQSAARINDPQSIVGWVRRVAINGCLMRLRSPWHARRKDMAELSVAGLDHRAGVDRQEEFELIERAFAQLAPRTRAVLWLHEGEGYTHQEIGEMLGKSRSYSKTQLARAYEKLLRWAQATASADEASPQSVLTPQDRPQDRSQAKPEDEPQEQSQDAQSKETQSPGPSERVRSKEKAQRDSAQRDSYGKAKLDGIGSPSAP